MRTLQKFISFSLVFLISQAAFASSFAPDQNSVLCYGPTITQWDDGGGLTSVEQQAIERLGSTFVLADEATWLSMNREEFCSYRSLCFGDPEDASYNGTQPELSSAISNVDVWSPCITGNVISALSDPSWHVRNDASSSIGPNAFEFIENAMRFASDVSDKTGAYISLSWYWHLAGAGKHIGLLESAFGCDFVVDGAASIGGGLNAAHIVADHPALGTLNDDNLKNWNNSIHAGFRSYGCGFLGLVIVTDVTGEKEIFNDGSEGLVYVIARGELLSPVECGNGVLDGDEQCDDQNTDNSDGCSAKCEVEDGWSCVGEPSVCTLDPVCGNGVIEDGELCDDQNITNNDGCSDTCVVENGWVCEEEPSTCNTVCGDGFIRGSELCDDENTISDDGCSSVCTVENGWTCVSEPSFCQVDSSCGNDIIDGGEWCDGVSFGLCVSHLCAADCGGCVEPITRLKVKIKKDRDMVIVSGRVEPDLFLDLDQTTFVFRLSNTAGVIDEWTLNPGDCEPPNERRCKIRNLFARVNGEGIYKLVLNKKPSPYDLILFRLSVYSQNLDQVVDPHMAFEVFVEQEHFGVFRDTWVEKRNGFFLSLPKLQ